MIYIVNPQPDKVLVAMKAYLDLMKVHWLKESLFTYQWWLLLVLSVVPWIVWWKLVDKKRLSQIALFGFIIITFVIVISPIGRNLSAWQYPHRLYWSLSTPYFPYELALIPIAYMLIYQYTSNWRTYILALIYNSVVFFGFEILFLRLDLIREYWWNPIYSLISFNIIALLVRWLSEWIVRIEMDSVFEKENHKNAR